MIILLGVLLILAVKELKEYGGWFAVFFAIIVFIVAEIIAKAAGV